NDWKTNQAWKINKKVIIPLGAFSAWSGKPDNDYTVHRKLSYIEKVLNYLDDARTDSHDLRVILNAAQSAGQSKKIVCKYFDVTFYKKGTCHIDFRDMDLLKKFILFSSQKKGWLPPSYGKAKYA